MGSMLSNKPYESCIKFNGRPILPPIISPNLSKQLARYKELAIGIERKMCNKKIEQLSKERACESFVSPIKAESIPSFRKGAEHTNDGTTNRNALSASINVPHNRSGGENYPTDISTPPSVASTDLARYMHMESDTEGPSCSSEYHVIGRPCLGKATIDVCTSALPVADQRQQHQTDFRSSRSVTPAGRETDLANNASGERFSPEVPTRNDTVERSEETLQTHLRKLSYTLEQPSPALVAHFQSLQLETDEKSKDVSDGEATGHEKDSEESSYCTAGTSSDVDRNGRQEHLHRYLCQVNDLGDRNGKASDGFVSFYDADDVALTLANDAEPDASVYEQMLLEQERCYEALRLEMEEQHRLRLEQLKRRQQDEAQALRWRMLLLHADQGVAPALKTYDSHYNMGETPCRSERSFSADPAAALRLESVPRVATLNELDPKREAAREVQGARASSAPDVPISKQYNGPSPQVILDMKPKFDRLSAAVKGYLVRRLFRTEKVQNIIKTIQDTLEFAVQLHSETPIKHGRVTPEEATLHQRILAQISSACYDFHDIFFKLSTKERMALISQDRTLKVEKRFNKADKEDTAKSLKRENPKLTSATLKALERRRHRTSESRSSVGSRQSQLRKVPSPRGGISPKEYCKMLSGAIHSGQARSASPRIAMRNRSPLDTSERADTSLSDKGNLRKVRRSLYGRYPTAKPRNKLTRIIK